MGKKGLNKNFVKELDGGGSFLVPKSKYEEHIKGKDNVGRDDGQYMTSAKQMNKVLHSANGDVSKINKALGTEFDPNEELIRIDVINPQMYNPRLPSDSMSGANGSYIPGGYTSGGIPELVIDQVPASQIYTTPLITN